MRPDEILLLDMLIAARRAVEFASQTTETDLRDDAMRQLAIVKAIEIIGEAADRVTDEFQNQHPEIPWREMTGMRHRLVHGYFSIDLGVVWDTVQRDLPKLIAVLERLVPPGSDV